MPESTRNATLTGGNAYIFNPRASKEQQVAAMRYIWEMDLRFRVDPKSAAEDAEETAKDPNGLVGLPKLSAFGPETQAKVDAAEEPFVNVPQENYAGYADRLNELTLSSEPPEDAQQVYTLVSKALQLLLTDSGADPAELLADAEKEVNQVLAAAR
ncbi:MAG: hypothetical protein GEU94_20675 [Micromonosporaceae bacterium]|nr:hypothetical protein [Micromonosporaceae bacterium]